MNEEIKEPLEHVGYAENETTTIETPGRIVEPEIPYIPEIPTVVVNELGETRTIPTFDELQLRYMLERGEPTYLRVAQIKTIYPERFTPENIEASFEYIYDFYANPDLKKEPFNILGCDFHW